MVKRLQPVLALLVLLGMVSGLGYVLFWAVSALIAYFAEFESEFAAALVATAGTVLIGVITVILTLRESKQKEVREAHRSEKVSVYKRFMETIIVGVLRQTLAGEKLSEEESVEKYQDFFITFTADLIVWGSPGVIQAYREFRRAGATEPQKMLLYIDNLLREIRKDLGNSNWQVGSGELMSMFLKNPDEMRMLVVAEKH